MENYFQTNEWLNQRLGRFTASEIHNLMGTGRDKNAEFSKQGYTYIRTKAAEILTQEVKEEINFKQGEWGKANEPEACQLFEKIIGIDGEHYGAGNPTFFPYGEYEGCSPDWEWMSEQVGADFKCPYNSAEHILNLMIESAAELKKEREEYYCQLQYSILRRGWVKGFFVSYDPRMAMEGQKIKIITVYPDFEWQDKYQKKIVLAIAELKAIINKVMNVDFALAFRDDSVNATIVEPASILQKVV